MKQKFLNTFIVLSLVLVGVLMFSMPTKALNLSDAFKQSGPLGTTGDRAGFNTSQNKVEPIIGNIISIILSFLGVAFLILMVYGGYIWMTAMGNEEKVKKAQQLIQAAILGLIVVVAAYAITIFVMDRISSDLLSSNSSVSGGVYSALGSSDNSVAYCVIDAIIAPFEKIKDCLCV